MTDREAEIRSALLATEDQIAAATAELSKLEDERDKLLLKLTDLEGAHDRRFVPCCKKTDAEEAR